jgi:hypothetical protein
LCFDPVDTTYQCSSVCTINNPTNLSPLGFVFGFVLALVILNTLNIRHLFSVGCDWLQKTPVTAVVWARASLTPLAFSSPRRNLRGKSVLLPFRNARSDAKNHQVSKDNPARRRMRLRRLGSKIRRAGFGCGHHMPEGNAGQRRNLPNGARA